MERVKANGRALVGRRDRETGNRSGNGRFGAGNELSVGNASPLVRKNRHYLSTRLRDALYEVESGGSMTWGQRVINQLVRLAAGGDLGAIRLCFERLEGAAVQSIAMARLDLNQPDKLIDRTMTPEAAEAAYLATMARINAEHESRQRFGPLDSDDDDGA
jgi:hypothetical protein